MQFDLVFENSGDHIGFEVVANHDLMGYFIDRAQKENHVFSDDLVVHKTVNKLLQDVNWALAKTNEILYDLTGHNFPQSDNLLDYLDQRMLNRQHCVWVHSQNTVIDIDSLRYSEQSSKSKLGYTLHDLYPDEIRKIKLAEAMSKLGYIFAYEEVNMTVHRLEMFFNRPIEYKSPEKWSVFDNPFVQSCHSTNDQVNFSFGYTYVGRQYYNKWQFFDTDLAFDDHYNYEQLEWAFQVNLGRPQTIAYSPEFLEWCRTRDVKPVTTQLPIANAKDLEKNLTVYRQMLYRNSRDGNRAQLFLR